MLEKGKGIRGACHHLDAPLIILKYLFLMMTQGEGERYLPHIRTMHDCSMCGHAVRYSLAFVLISSLATCTAFGGHPFSSRGMSEACASCSRQAPTNQCIAGLFQERKRTSVFSNSFSESRKFTSQSRSSTRIHSASTPATDEIDCHNDASTQDEDERTYTAQTDNPDPSLESALASHAQESSPLLGIKSIGIDYGGVRTGLAATIGYDFRPLRIVSDLNNADLCQEVISTAKSESAERIVVGLPLHKNGTESERSNITRCFAAELTALVLSNFGPDFGGVYLWDERYTSKEAKARIMSTAKGRGGIRSADDLDGTIDADAARLILEDYYQNSGVGAELVEVSEGYVRDKCLEAWNVEKQRQEQAKEDTKRKREEALNARQLMMNRVKEMEAAAAAAAAAGGGDGAGKKKRKKKRKKKK